MLMIIFPDGVSGKTVEAAFFLHLNITFSTGNGALDWRIWVKMYMVSDNLCMSYFFLSRSAYAFLKQIEKKNCFDLMCFEYVESYVI